MVPWYFSKAKSGSVSSLNDGSLSTAAPAKTGGTTSYEYPDPQWKIGVVSFGPAGPDPVARQLTFTSVPLEEDIEVGGPIVCVLHVASTATDTDFFVRLADQFPQSPEERKAGKQPAAINVSKGWLRASHREKDEQRSTAYRPFYTHTNPQPIKPGEVYEYEIEVLPAAYLFKKGHRIRVELSNADSPITDSLFSHQYMWYKVGADTVHHSAVRPSRILLPVVGASSRR